MELSEYAGQSTRINDFYIHVSDGIQLYCIDFIPKHDNVSKPIIFFVAGWLSHISGWKDVLRSLTDEYHVIYIETREKANNVHEEVKATFGKIRKANKGMDRVKAKERSIEDEIVRKKNSEEKEKAEEIYRKFREGKKVSTEELMLLQKHNIV